MTLKGQGHDPNMLKARRKKLAMLFSNRY